MHVQQWQIQYGTEICKRYTHLWSKHDFGTEWDRHPFFILLVLQEVFIIIIIMIIAHHLNYIFVNLGEVAVWD